MTKRSHYGYRARGGQRATHTTPAPRLGDAGTTAAKLSTMALRDHARWMNFHETALMPARRRGGEAEVRRVLKQACADGLISMSDVQLAQEVCDVMAAPDLSI